MMAFLSRLESYGAAPMLFFALLVFLGALAMLNSVGLSDLATVGLGIISLSGYVLYLRATRGSHHAAMRDARQRVTAERLEGQDMRARRRAALPPPQNQQLKLELKPRSRNGGRDDVGR